MEKKKKKQPESLWDQEDEVRRFVCESALQKEKTGGDGSSPCVTPAGRGTEGRL